MSLGPGRIVLLILCIFLLTLAFLPCQGMIVIQRSVLETSFLLPHVENVLSALGAPDTHESMVHYIVRTMERENSIRVPADINEKLMAASVKALSPQWVQEEMLQILNKVLSVLRGKSDKIEHTFHLSRRKDVLISELARSLPEEMVAEISASSGIIPDAVALHDVMGDEIQSVFVTLGKRYILFSLLFIYVVPGVLLLLTIQVGRYGWGTIGAGAGAFLGGTAFALAASLGIGPLYQRFVPQAVRAMPREFRWIGSTLADIVEDIRLLGRRTGIVFGIAGIALVGVGIVVQILLARTSSTSD